MKGIGKWICMAIVAASIAVFVSGCDCDKSGAAGTPPKDHPAH